MSFALVNAALAQPMPPARRAVLLALADMANQAGVCWPRIATIARRACMSVRSVFTHLKELVAAGLLTRRQRIGRSSLYSLTGQALATSTHAPADAVSTPTASTERATSAPPPEVAPTPQPAQPSAPVPAVAPIAPAVLTVGSVVQAMRDVGLLGAYDCAPLAALVASASPTDGVSEFTSVAGEAVVKHKGFPWALAVIKGRRADRAALVATVPGMAGRDPVLVQLEQDAALATPPPASIREKLTRLRAEIVGTVVGSTAGAGA